MYTFHLALEDSLSERSARSPSAPTAWYSTTPGSFFGGGTLNTSSPDPGTPHGGRAVIVAPNFEMRLSVQK